MCLYVPAEILERKTLTLNLAHNPYETQLAVHEMGMSSLPYFLEVLWRKPLGKTEKCRGSTAVQRGREVNTFDIIGRFLEI